MSRKFAASAFSLCLLASGLLPRSLLAATSTTSVGVSATVQAGCLVSTASVPSPEHLAISAMAKPGISVTCTMATPYAVDVRPEERLAGVYGTVTKTPSVLTSAALAGYRSAIKGGPWINAGPYTVRMECRPTQSIAAAASTHVITVLVTY